MLNMVRLLKGECRANNEELKKFQKGDTIWGNDENPEELKRWKIEEKEEGRLFSRLFLCVFVISFLSTCNHVVYSFANNL